MAETPRASVLIVEDDGELLEVLKYVLEDDGYRVFEANNGPDALNLLASESIDLVILDVQMSGMNGFEVARSLRTDAHTALVKISLHTGMSEEAVRAEFEDYDGYLQKGDDVKVLLESVSQTLARSRST